MAIIKIIERNNIQLDEWQNVWNISKEEIKELLENDCSIYTDATSMFSGSHRWYIEKGQIKCFGSGQNWRDQDNETSLSNEEAFQRISKIAKTQKILISRQ